jgi:hypothetical protein
MKVKLWRFVALSVLALTALPTYASPVGRAKPVLLELFTSEGCSDCPPADHLLTQLVENQPVPGAHIIALEEHVGYWNNPKHWVDPFSTLASTNRQYSYAMTFNDDSPYTPEMVVNGGVHFVGSDADAANKAIRDAETSQIANVELSIVALNDGNATIQVSIQNAPALLAGKKVVVLLAVTEGNLISHVTGGENRGTTLAHTSVTRSLNFIGYLSTSGDNIFNTTIPIDAHWSKHSLNAVAFIQDTSSKLIYGAAEQPLF